MTYVRIYGRPDLFITFTCNPKWDELRNLLIDDQLPIDHHDIVARVFNQKLKALMSIITTFQVFDEVNCCTEKKMSFF